MPCQLHERDVLHGAVAGEVALSEADGATSGERERGELLELKQLARVLRRGRPVSPETQRHNERVAKGLRVTGDVIRWVRTGGAVAAEFGQT